MKQISIILFLILHLFGKSSLAISPQNILSETFSKDSKIVVGAERIKEYLPIIKGERVALVVNHTSYIGKRHLVDSLLKRNINITKIFAPEHGFRGKADAGETILDGVDVATGIPVISLYGNLKKPTPEHLENVDILIFDIQDVGARFYTFISTLHNIMEAAAENEKRVIILDRPNPNGHYVAGPVLNTMYRSFIGMHTVPIVHGMTVGEYGKMVNEEGWLANGVKCKLKVIPCLGYDHQTFYEVPIKPSPNLPNMASIYLYPSICLFEGTKVSEGRGTPYPFQLFGHPETLCYPHSFVPRPGEGSMNPKHNGVTCHGIFLGDLPMEEIQNTGFTLKWLIEMYKSAPDKTVFFTGFFKKLAGNEQLQKDIEAGLSEEEIIATWQDDLNKFKQIRKKYLLYPDFE